MINPTPRDESYDAEAAGLVEKHGGACNALIALTDGGEINNVALPVVLRLIVGSIKEIRSSK